MTEYLNFTDGTKIKIPRTFYELVLIRKTISEHLSIGKLCLGLEPDSHNIRFDDIMGTKYDNEDYEEEILIRKKYLKHIDENTCWHQCYFPKFTDNNHPNVIKLAKMLNDIIIEEYKLCPKNLSLDDIISMTNKELDFLENYYNDCRMKKSIIQSCSNPGTTTNFGYESIRGKIRSMCVNNEINRKIIINAVKIESNLPDDKIILYRGSNLSDDNVFDKTNSDILFSLSYGTSLFAGCIFDGGATPFFYMRKKENAYALIVPKKCAIFYLPEPGLSQMYGRGEVFHVRTKAWDGYVNCRDILKSDIPKVELVRQFNEIKNTAIHLK